MFFNSSSKEKLNKELKKEAWILYDRNMKSKLKKDISDVILITTESAASFISIYDQTLKKQNLLSDSDYKAEINYKTLYKAFISYYIFALLQMYKNSKDLREKLDIKIEDLLGKFDSVVGIKDVILPMLEQASKKEDEYEGNVMEVFGFFYFQTLSMIIFESKFNEIFESTMKSPIDRMLIQNSSPIYFEAYSESIRTALKLSEKIS